MMQSQELRNHLKKLEGRLLTVYAVGLVILVGLSLVSNFVMKDQAARQATSMIKRTVARDFRETVLTLNDAELDYFSAVVYFDQRGQRVFSLPANLDPAMYQNPSFLERLSTARITTNLYFDHEESKKVGSVLYIFNRFSQVKWAVLIWLSFLLGTIPLVRYSRHWITENYKKDLVLREESTRAALAQRVRHDIRSPLGALKVATRDLENLTTRQKRIIKRATTRIDEIVLELELIRSTSEAIPNVAALDTMESASLLSIVQEIIQEKRSRLSDGSVDGENQGPILVPQVSKNAFFLFSKINVAEMKRTVSNIVENAIEACVEKGRIVVQLHEGDGGVNVIEIQDNGAGIAPEYLSRVTEKGFSFGKKHGTGLGLYYAKLYVESVGGRLEIASTLGRGTTIRIILPASMPPKWHRPVLEIPRDGAVVILDDQEASRLTLAERIEEMSEAKIESFSTPSDLIAWHRTHSPLSPKTLYLLDFDLGSGQQSGLGVAEELGLSSNAILVTGHFDSSEIQDRCAELGIGLIPKSFLSEIEILAV